MGRFKRIWREMQAMNYHKSGHAAAFKLGYVTALDDIQRTGLQPVREDTKQQSAEHALKRLFLDE